MPKEIINSQYHNAHDPRDACKALFCEVRMELSWGRGLPDVQIASTNPTAGGPHDSAYGWFAHLDREGVNRLIRALRKARDQAFGADA